MLYLIHALSTKIQSISIPDSIDCTTATAFPGSSFFPWASWRGWSKIISLASTSSELFGAWIPFRDIVIQWYLVVTRFYFFNCIMSWIAVWIIPKNKKKLRCSKPVTMRYHYERKKTLPDWHRINWYLTFSSTPFEAAWPLLRSEVESRKDASLKPPYVENRFFHSFHLLQC